jgi:uncharacterized protein (DUF2236 family)
MVTGSSLKRAKSRYHCCDPKQLYWHASQVSGFLRQHSWWMCILKVISFAEAASWKYMQTKKVHQTTTGLVIKVPEKLAELCSTSSRKMPLTHKSGNAAV